MNETINSVKDVVNSLMPYLEQAAEKLGTTAQYLWALQVKQAYVVAFQYLISYVVFGLGWYWLIKFAKYMFEKDDDCYNPRRYQREDGLAIIGFFTGLIFVVISIIYFLSTFQTVLTMLFNPEYWALSEVVKLLRGGK